MGQCIEISLKDLPEVVAAGIHKVEKPWKHRYRKVPVNTMLFVFEGTLFVKENGINYTVPKNHILFFKADAVQEGYKYIEAGAKWFWVNFLEYELTEQPDQLITLAKIIETKKVHGLHQQLNRLVELYISQEYLRQEQLNGLFNQLLLGVIMETHTQHSITKSNQISLRVIDILKEQMKSEFDSNMISETLSMNYKYIGRKFKAETGNTIKRYYLTMKINEAILLLQTTSKNISEISDVLNFPNPYYFSRLFKQIKGVSPNNYKKQMYSTSNNDIS